MNEVMLAKALRERITHDVRNMQFPQEGSTIPACPTVHNGHLPPAMSQGAPDVFPYIIVRPVTGETTATDETTCTIDILVGAYEETSDGYELCLLVVDALRRSFTEKPILADMFIHERPFKWRNVEGSPWPFWGLVITTRWVVPTPQVQDVNL